MTKTAIILAARRERDSEIPYPLRPFDKEGQTTLMSRTLSILDSLGFDNIVIVAGYKAELFQQLSSPTVHVVINPDYAFTSSMASLARAATLVDSDFLLIESDVICQESLYKQLAEIEEGNCLTVANECGNKDEALVETASGRIVKISKDIHQFCRVDGEMVGISRISRETFRKMMMRWESNNNPLLNYEYLFLDCTDIHERRYIKPHELIWCEVDDHAQFRRLKDQVYPHLRRSEDPFDYQNIIAHLRDVFPDEELDNSLHIEYIGGMTNRNFRISLHGSDYVIRIPGNGTEGMIERRNEGRNTVISNRLELSPAVKYINDDTGIKVTDFITGAETLGAATIQRYDNLIQVADILKKLHTSGVRLNNEFNVFNELEKYEQLMHQAGAEMYEGYDEIRPQILALADRLNELGVQLRPCHNDLVPENFIKDSSGRIFLIDWEYSGMNDPMWDLGALFLESEFSEESRLILLRRYFGHEPTDADLERILIYQILADTLWSVWTVIKEKQGDDFGDYGPMRYNRAAANLKIFQNLKK